jgi:hypothetical protein
MGLPIPEIYMQQVTTADGITNYKIVDGQQRIRTVLQFIGSEQDADEQEFNKFALDKLETNSRWYSRTFADLPVDEKKAFYGYKFVVRNLNTDKDEEIRDMFRRLNKFLTPLNAQELRNATYMGPFVSFVLKLADNEYWAENRIVTPAQIRRMGDIEFISELVIGVLHGPQGGSSKIVDEYYGQYEDYDDEFPNQRKAERTFKETLGVIQELLPDIKDTRWGNKTDFYSLFVAVAGFLKSNKISSRKYSDLRKALDRFASEVDSRLADEHVRVRSVAIDYVHAVEKGANDKKRRGDRHLVLTNLLAQGM